MANLRQSILIREDLNFARGLLCAQVGHLHFESNRLDLLREVLPEGDEKEWLKDPYIFVHGLPNVEVLSFFEEKAMRLNVPVTPWKDTVFINLAPNMPQAFENVLVGITLGPCDSDRIKAVIGELPLLK